MLIIQHLYLHTIIFQKLSHNMPRVKVPPGWTRKKVGRRIVYISEPPRSTIRNIEHFDNFKKNGRFPTIDREMLNFSAKFENESTDTEDCVEDMDIDDEHEQQEDKLVHLDDEQSHESGPGVDGEAGQGGAGQGEEGQCEAGQSRAGYKSTTGLPGRARHQNGARDHVETEHQSSAGDQGGVRHQGGGDYQGGGDHQGGGQDRGGQPGELEHQGGIGHQEGVRLFHQSDAGHQVREGNHIRSVTSEPFLFGGKVDREREKVDKIVEQLTVKNSTKLEHRKVLLDIAGKLNDLKHKNCTLEEINFDYLKQTIEESESGDAMLESLWKCPGVRDYFLKRETSSNLEDLLLLSDTKSPLTEFPPDVNSNVYCDLISFGLEHSPGLIAFLLNLLVRKEKPVQEKDVVKIAFLFSSIAHSISKKNNALAKTKTLLLQSQGLTKEGLDSMSLLGVSETGRSALNSTNILAEVSESILRQSCKTMSTQSTVDNLGKSKLI